MIINGTYQLTGAEVKWEAKEKCPCGEIVTTKYYLGPDLVRVDQTVNVSQEAMSLGLESKF